MTRNLNGPVGRSLMDLFNALQVRGTTFGEIYAMSLSCGIDGRRVLADHFNRATVIVALLEA